MFDKLGVLLVYAGLALAVLFFASGCVAFAQGNTQAALHFDAQAATMLLLGIWLHVCS